MEYHQSLVLYIKIKAALNFTEFSAFNYPVQDKELFGNVLNPTGNIFNALRTTSYIIKAKLFFTQKNEQLKTATKIIKKTIADTDMKIFFITNTKKRERERALLLKAKCRLFFYGEKDGKN